MFPLDLGFLNNRLPADVDESLRRIVRSNRFEVTGDGATLRILGPDVQYHQLDPFLPAGLTRLSAGLQMEDAASFHTSTPAFDLCLEDSWSGFFMAEWLRASPDAADIVFVHLDHHTDMMSSLLERRDATLIDPTRACLFDPGCGQHWRLGISSGSIGIGSFVTTLFELPHRLHVRHVNNYRTSDYTTYRVVRAVRCYPEIPGRSFACIRKRRDDPADAVGTYRGGCDPAKVLADLPAGRVVVHIDLDYFINDFNGNPVEEGWTPGADAQDAADIRLEAFFSALEEAGVDVERWIVATSPGFCSAYHWPRLLEGIERGIERVSG